MLVKRWRFVLSLVTIFFCYSVFLNVDAAHADITCANSDYNCIYTNGSNRIVCNRINCGPGTELGNTYYLEGLYAFDGINPNDATTTLAPAQLSISMNGGNASATGTGSCSYSGGVFTDASFSSAWNVVWTPQAVSCNWSGSFVSSNLAPLTTYYLKITFTDNSGSVTGTSSFTTPAAETTTTLSAVSTTTIPGVVNPCLDPSNPDYVCGWAVLDANNRVGNVIVCTYAVCGTGLFGGMRLVLQTQQMPGGNVAGWNGGTYNEQTGTFELPGGGSLKSGDKIEEAIFPKIENPDVIEAIAAPSGKVYETTEEYANAETETVITSAIISIDLPVFPVRELTYQVSFDPTGSAPEVVIESGTIVNQTVASSVSTQSFHTLSSVSSPVKNSSKIVLNRELLKGKNGLLKVKLRTTAKNYAEVDVKIAQPKKYASCRALVKDYPGGLIASSKWSDKKSLKQKFDYVAIPVLNVRAFALNLRLDFDKDKVVCERNN